MINGIIVHRTREEAPKSDAVSKFYITTLSKYRKSIIAWEFGYGNAIFELFKKKTDGKEVLLDGV